MRPRWLPKGGTERLTDLHDFGCQGVYLAGRNPGQQPLQQLAPGRAKVGKAGDHVTPQEVFPPQSQAHVYRHLRRAADGPIIATCQGHANWLHAKKSFGPLAEHAHQHCHPNFPHQRKETIMLQVRVL